MHVRKNREALRPRGGTGRDWPSKTGAQVTQRRTRFSHSKCPLATRNENRPEKDAEPPPLQGTQEPPRGHRNGWRARKVESRKRKSESLPVKRRRRDGPRRGQAGRGPGHAGRCHVLGKEVTTRSAPAPAIPLLGAAPDVCPSVHPTVRRTSVRLSIPAQGPPGGCCPPSCPRTRLPGLEGKITFYPQTVWPAEWPRQRAGGSQGDGSALSPVRGAHV